MGTFSESIKNLISPHNFWARNIVVIILLSILANHLTEPEHFPFHEDYSFPWIPVLASVILGGIMLVIAYYNFEYFKRKHFVNGINVGILVKFMLSTLCYITVVYILFYLTLNIVFNGVDALELYHFLSGYSISMISSALLISILMAADVYAIYTQLKSDKKLKITSSGRVRYIQFDQLAYFFSEHKIVRLVTTEAEMITTDFNLNELESNLEKQVFFRANRQFIIHPRAVDQVKSIENGKMLVRLQPSLPAHEQVEINISRYKKQSLMDWMELHL
ncbi:LytR/AlgR family response regulator transcription factor [Nonlabens xiamenensis]|uniref:LytR/AlgR family response regulator transcription factor n=1 Tax=Nonlabens xiamenensis TaxID=2341043 RepID=UPI0013DE410F|nr:LytTR family DNA-binding domain-containing protein [Nonlabens xiamenensis]